jgi:DNA-binding LacI/PurR family transcriptional regulator
LKCLREYYIFAFLKETKLKNNATIKDIARELDIHHTTVSRALRGGGSVKNATRELIWKKAQELGYKPNLLAQGFRNSKSNTIGILVPDLKHHFFANFISYFSQEAHLSGYAVMIFQSSEKLKIEKELVDSLISYRIAGVIASVSKETKDSRHFDALREADIPLVFFDRVPEDSKTSQVVVDNRQGAYDAVNLMIRGGRKKIAFISSASHINVFRERLDGYRQALADSHMEFREKFCVKGGFFMEDGVAGAKKLLELPERPDGILAVTDEVGIGVIKYLRKEGIRVPEDIAVIGFDNDPMCIACEPELTTVMQSIPKLTKETFETLVQHMKDNTLEPESKKIKAEIILRGSC